MPVIQNQPATRTGRKSALRLALDLPAATLFLRGEAASLAHGLGGDRNTVRDTLAAHSRSHERWLALVAEARNSLGDDAGQRVAALYALHGRVAESMARRSGELLEARTAQAVQEMLIEWLDQLTDATLARLRHENDPDPFPG